MKREKKIKKDILNLIAFCILMENGKGVVNKSPDYILKKLRRYWAGEENEWMWGLDRNNFKKLKEWARKWQNRDLDKEVEEFETMREEELKAEAEWEAQQRAEDEWRAIQEEQMRAEWEAGQGPPEAEVPY